MQKLPVVSGKQLLKALTKLGYQIVRQKGNHARLTKKMEEREHHITVLMQTQLKKGTLKEILLRAEISLEEFVKLLK